MSADAARCHVVIVTHNSEFGFARCIRALQQQVGLTLDIVVVDNGSLVDPATLLEDAGGIRWLRNQGNPGFAVACNQGAALTRCEWLLFLNPDCLLGPTAVADLLRVAQSRTGEGLLGAQLLESDGSPQPAARRLAPRPRQLLGGRLDLPTPDWGSDGAAAPEFEALEGVSGALMLLSRELFVELGGFDEGYRLHCEDLDLCRRVREHGAWVGIAPRVRVQHLKGTSSRRRPFWVEWQKHRGMWRYYSKFDRARSPWWVSLSIALGLIAHYPWAALRAAWRARRPIS